MPVQRKAYQGRSDEVLMSLMQSGEEAAFNVLYERYGHRLYRYFYRMLGQDEALAGDCTQELFLRLIEKSAAFDPNRRFSAWIYAIAANMVKNEYRSRSRRPELQRLPEEGLPQDTAPELFARLDASARQRLLEQALQGLSEQQRECFLLRYQEELPIQEISEIVGCPEGTVKSRLHYALRKLNERLSGVVGSEK